MRQPGKLGAIGAHDVERPLERRPRGVAVPLCFLSQSQVDQRQPDCRVRLAQNLRSDHLRLRKNRSAVGDRGCGACDSRRTLAQEQRLQSNRVLPRLAGLGGQLEPVAGMRSSSARYNDACVRPPKSACSSSLNLTRASRHWSSFASRRHPSASNHK